MNPSKYFREKSTLLIGLIVALLLFALLLQPEIVSTYWHLRYGDTIGFHGWIFHVPNGWWVLKRDDQLILQKMDRFYERDEPEEIILSTLNPPRPVALDALKYAAIQMYLKRGSALKEDRPIQLGGGTGYCLHFSASNGEKQLHITCDSLDAQLSLDFWGRSSDVQTLYSLINQARKTQIEPRH